MTTAARLVLWLALSAVAAPVRAQIPLNPQPVRVEDCKKCKRTGRLPCPEHPRAECDLESEVLYCSVFIDCASCGGVAQILCPTCQDPPTKAALALRREELQERKLGLKPLDDKMGRHLRKAEGAHVIVVWEIDRMKVDKRFLGAHELLHLTLRRMEQVYADYLSVMRITDKEFKEKLRFFVWNFVEDQELGNLKFCGQAGRGPMKLMGFTPSYSVCGHKRFFQDDDDLHRNLVHVASHLLLSAQEPVAWIGNQKAGWADEGLAHWFEDRYFGICDTYCYQEVNANVDFKGGKYRLSMRQLVEAGKLPPIAEVFQQNIDTLTVQMHAAAFSYVDYLISRDGQKFEQLIKKLKAKTTTRDALKEVYGFSPIEFEELWKAWVLATYPTR